ncbi:uncharacterized protein G2W53_033192 [Senna tora]|uniref:Uncharacterized protein n=1 Tax=Senna tora TaxID=362788 RepID=A0A834SYU1_9FABA|nr:uncharacterized protein G2W53_033192 [Senna tora]
MRPNIHWILGLPSASRRYLFYLKPFCQNILFFFLPLGDAIITSCVSKDVAQRTMEIPSHPRASIDLNDRGHFREMVKSIDDSLSIS